MSTWKRARILELLAQFSAPASNRDLVSVTGYSTQSIYRHMLVLIADGKAHIDHYRTQPRGGTPESMYKAGPAPEGHTVMIRAAAEEVLKAREEHHKERMRKNSRAYKQRKRLAARQITAQTPEEELPDDDSVWIDPNFKPRKTPHSNQFQALFSALYSIPPTQQTQS